MHTTKALVIATTAIISISLFSYTTFASQKSVTQNYTIKLIEDCQVFKEIPLTPKQTQAYLALKDEEEIMRKLEVPIPKIEQQLNKYTSQIEQLAQQAFADSAQSLKINKAALAKQKLVVKKLNKLIALHQKDFDALSAQGKRIGAVADKFSQLIKPTIANIEHTQLTISRQDEIFSAKSCNSENDFIAF